MAENAPGSARTAQAADSTESEFDSLLKREFRPRTEAAQSAVEKAVKTLAQQALENAAILSDDVLQSLEGIIAELDRKLADQINQIIHHEDYQQLESAWRGLHHLVKNTETDEMLKIRVMHITKTDLHKTLRKFKGAAWDRSPIFKKLYEEEYGVFGGEPYGCLVGDYYFNHSPSDVELLGEMAKISEAIHAPFITGADPSLMQFESWQELSNPRDLTKVFQTPEYAAWRSLRDSEASKFIGLTMPRFLVRLPFGAKGDPVDAFAFEEETGNAESDYFSWANSAYAMAANITRSFKMYGWCSRIRGVESGGTVEGLPTHSFPTSDGGVDMKCPTEISIPERREAELSRNGMMALVHRKNSDMAAFLGAQSLHKPAVYDDPDATANANLAARLPYLFATCRFAHSLKKMAHDKIGSFKSRDDMQRWLQKWINQYIDTTPGTSTEETKARKPLTAAEVIVEDVEGSPGYYTSQFFLRPHYQLEGLTVSLRLVSKLPSEKRA